VQPVWAGADQQHVIVWLFGTDALRSPPSSSDDGGFFSFLIKDLMF
jgi:hypothetical protein